MQRQMLCPRCGKDHSPGSEDCPGRRLGQQVGRYRLEVLLGVGGMGAVYRAQHTGLEQSVAVKMLLPVLGGRPELVERFFREARASARIGHPGIVRVHDLGRADDGTPYMVMELLQGLPLNTLSGGNPLPYRLAVEIGIEVLQTVQAAHDQGIVHRDLKPENLFLLRTYQRPRTRVLDFGIAWVKQESDDVRLTVTGNQLGTPSYMSPEQAMHPKSEDPRMDIYSLGATVFALLTGRPPVDGGSGSEIIARLALGHIHRSVKVFRPDVPDWLQEIVGSALEQDPANRPDSARRMAELLAEGLRQFPPPDSPAEKLTLDSDLAEIVSGVAGQARGREAGASPPDLRTVPATGAFDGHRTPTARSTEGGAVKQAGSVDAGENGEAVGLRGSYQGREQARSGASITTGSATPFAGLSGTPLLEPLPGSPRTPSPEANESATSRSLQKSSFRPGARLSIPPARLWSGAVVVLLVGVGLTLFQRYSNSVTGEDSVPEGGGQQIPASPAPAKLQGPPPGMMSIPGGTFEMGSRPEEIRQAFDWCRKFFSQCRQEIYEREKPSRMVTVSPFYLDIREVTNKDVAEWLLDPVDIEVKGNGILRRGVKLAELDPEFGGITFRVTPYPTDAPFQTRSDYSDRPAVLMTWYGAAQYCRDIGKQLPTEAQWEMAARGTARRTFPWGENRPFDDDRPWCGYVVFGQNDETGCPGKYAPEPAGSGLLDRTPEGILDLAGNVSEWVFDTFQESYKKCTLRCKDPLENATNEIQHVVRGGNWNSLPEQLRGAGRSRLDAGKATLDVGFRCAKPVGD